MGTGDDKDWGCWSCGNEEGRVLSVARDEDGNKVRLRRCTKCGDRWVTEERRLARSVTFSQRAFSAAEHQRARRAKHRTRCRFCKGRYQLGTWYGHVANSPIHRAWKAKRDEEIRQYKVEDAYWRYWADPVYRQRQIESASRRGRERRRSMRDAASSDRKNGGESAPPRAA